MTGESETQTSSPAHTHNTDQTIAQRQQPNGTTAQEALSTTKRGSNIDSDRTTDTDTDTDTDASGDTKEKMRSNRSHKNSASDNTTADDKAHSSEGKTNAKNSTLLGANHCATAPLTTATATATATSPLLNLERVKGNRANTSNHAYDTQDTPGIATAPPHTDAPAYTAQTNGKQQDNTTKSGTESGTGTGTERREGDGSAQPQSHQPQTQPMHHTNTANAPQNNVHHSADGHSRQSSEQAEAQDTHSHTAHQHNTQQRKTQNGMQHDGPLTKEAVIKREVGIYYAVTNAPSA
ncbi:hypothetical protein SARC_16842 [Sphaeroforma arctica JP610]|uniref:Uncharacterized protein n=1 Tax=Sphaeroforma arctica JP610 TaxID=667725 RepID=A0A0L0F1Q9_9EUKA|nr:hypothetical protein SARC_16842 [Sphaeroforma arctica JP610]KNC70627.1 hypothetical protein SARC_16842 [Sphaeroforma arctica JP610]|eukprot:XP_014144529.1 hypothetical protein SARC_16842 [Sphaeroforma arctica JP610]